MSGDSKQLTPKMHGIEDHVPHRVNNDELYRRSTQYRFWSFNEENLKDLRIKLNKRGEEIFKKRIKQLNDDTDLLIKEFVNESNNDKLTQISVNEERLIIIYYARKCKDLSNFFKFSNQVKLTAISYLFKFYLSHSIMEYYPQQIMYTCLFLSAKSENNFIGIKNFSNAIPKTTPESILKYEYLILESLRFSLMCHHPLRPLYGFYLDIQNVLTKIDFNRLYKDYLSCKNLINDSSFNDIQFLFTPPQIALASLYIVDDVVCMRYLMRKFGVKRKQRLEKMNELENEKNGVITKSGNENEDKEVKIETNKDGVKEEIKEEIKEETKEETKEEIKEEFKDPKDQKPIERYEKMIKIIKECVKKMQEQIDPTVEEAKIISLKAHFCLDPVKYFKKISKDVINTNKREHNESNNEVDDDKNDVKRVKLE